LTVRTRRVLGLFGISILAWSLLPGAARAGMAPAHAVKPAALPAGADAVLRPLRQLSPDANAYLATRAGSISVAVVLLGTPTVYAAQSGPRFPLASLTKLAIMVTVLDRGSREQRALTVRELALLEAMIERSDNDAASTLWASVGGGEAVAHYLRGVGLTEFTPGTGSHWGDSTDTALDVATLLGDLADGSILTDSQRGLAVVLMSRIVASQRWGVTAGLPAGALLAFKNGWLQGDDGSWRLDSAGLVFPGGGAPAYALVILTDRQPNLYDGVHTIEHLATLLHAALRPVP
jgi:beta-lactamase class A